MMSGLLSTTAKASMRPPITAGPISRNFSGLNVVLISVAARMIAKRMDTAILLLNCRAAETLTLRGRQRQDERREIRHREGPGAHDQAPAGVLGIDSGRHRKLDRNRQPLLASNGLRNYICEPRRR